MPIDQPDTAPGTAETHSDGFAEVVGARILLALREAVADRRRRGLPIAVSRGSGVQLIP